MNTQTIPDPAQDSISSAAVSPQRHRRGTRAKIVLKSQLILLAHDATVDDAIAAIITNTRDHWAVNEAAARQGRDVEGAASWRAQGTGRRSALSLFKTFIPETQRKWLNGEARWLHNELGAVRDLDVFAAKFLPTATLDVPHPQNMRTIKKALRAARHLAQDRASTALESMRSRRFMRRLETWLARRGWRVAMENEVKNARTSLVRDSALRALNKRLIEILAHGKRLDTLSVEQLHEIRISVKKIRYGTEFFQTVLPKRRATKLASILKDLQDSLGHLNALVVAEQIVGQLAAAVKNTKASSSIAAAGMMVIAYHRRAANDAAHSIISRWRELRKFGLIE